MARGSGMPVTRRISRNRPKAISEAERDEIKRGWYRNLADWLSAPEDLGYPDPPSALILSKQRRKR